MLVARDLGYSDFIKVKRFSFIKIWGHIKVELIVEQRTGRECIQLVKVGERIGRK